MESDAPAPAPKHILISGGGFAGGFALYGALRETHAQNRWSRDQIKSISGVSVGTIIATVLALGHDWDTLDNYLIHRPWGSLLQLEKLDWLGAFTRCGFLDRAFIVDAIAPLFRARDFALTVTMSEFCRATGIDLFFYCTELYEYEYVCMSPETTADLSVIDAIYRSCCLPIIFVPEKTPEHFYLDGFLINNYPVVELERRGVAAADAIGFRFQEQHKKHIITNMFDMILYIFMALFFRRGNVGPRLTHEVCLSFSNMEMTAAMLQSAEKRREVIEMGVTAARGAES